MWGKVSCLRKQHDGRDWASNHQPSDLKSNTQTTAPLYPPLFHLNKYIDIFTILPTDYKVRTTLQCIIFCPQIQKLGLSHRTQRLTPQRYKQGKSKRCKQAHQQTFYFVMLQHVNNTRILHFNHCLHVLPY